MKSSFINGLFFVGLTLATGFFILIATSRNAYGYVDPGSGLLALQTFASVMAACGFFLRRRLKSLFGIKSQPRDGNAAETSTGKTSSHKAA